MVEQIDVVENLKKRDDRPHRCERHFKYKKKSKEFKTLNTELDYVALEVDLEFQKLQETAETRQLNPRKNIPVVKPTEMLHRLSQIKIEFKRLVQEVENFRRSEKEAMVFFRDNLASACENLEKLQMQARLEVASKKPAELQKLEALLDNESPCPDASDQPSWAEGDNATSTPR